MSELIRFLNLIGAILAVISWIKKPKTKLLSILGMIVGTISIAVADYTLLSFVMLMIFIFILIIIYSVQTASEFENHIVQAQVLFKEPSKKQLITLSKKALEKPLIEPTKIAKGLELIARKGEKFSKAKEIIVAGAHLSLGLSSNFIMCISLLIKLKRYFRYVGEYERIADKLCVTASKGVQPEEVNQAFDAYNKECFFSNRLCLDEFLALLLVLSNRETRGEIAGSDLANFINRLTDIQIAGNLDNLLRSTL